MFVCFLALWRFFLRDVVQWKRTRLFLSMLIDVYLEGRDDFKIRFSDFRPSGSAVVHSVH
jgi:hypothetical protein